MSGYVVLLRRDGIAVSQAELSHLLQPLAARGPDGAECWMANELGVASTLLHTGDWRLVPRVTHLAGHLWVAGQIRVDDRASLVRALRDDGHHGSEDEADVVLFARAWLAWDERALERVLGDFSAVVHDNVTGRTTLVRDAFGVRMLYYRLSPSALIASNTLNAIRAAPGVSSALNEDAVADYITVGLNEDLAATTFRDIQRVPPAHLLRIDREGRSILRRYWSLPVLREHRGPSESERLEEFRSVLTRCVGDRMRSPRLTIFLSGGIDSGSLAALAVRNAGSPEGIRARTVEMPTIAPNAPDLARARLTTERLGIAHDVIDVDDFGYREGTNAPLPTTPEPYDEPDLAVVHAEFLAASRWSPVSMWGEDPDSLMAPPNLLDLVRARGPWRLAADVLHHAKVHRSRPYLGVRQMIAGQVQRWRGHRDEDEAPSWLRADLRMAREARVAARRAPDHATRSAMAIRIANPLLQLFLERTDAGVHGQPLEVRHPYFDRRLIDVILRAPAIPFLQRKYLLRESMSGIVPDEVRHAPKRGLPGFFEARLAQWRRRGPMPFTPTAALSHFVDIDALPVVDASSDTATLLVHLRLRILDRWLRGCGT